MANNFKEWSSSGTNLPSTSDFNNESGQRGTGFQPNTVASSQFVNAGLKQANLFVAAFMQAVNDAGVDISSLDFTSNALYVKNAIKSYLNSIPKLYVHQISICTSVSNDMGWMPITIYSPSAELITGSGSQADKVANFAQWLTTKGYSDDFTALQCCGPNNANGTICGIYGGVDQYDNPQIKLVYFSEAYDNTSIRAYDVSSQHDSIKESVMIL